MPRDPIKKVLRDIENRYSKAAADQMFAELTKKEYALDKAEGLMAIYSEGANGDSDPDPAGTRNLFEEIQARIDVASQGLNNEATRTWIGSGRPREDQNTVDFDLENVAVDSNEAFVGNSGTVTTGGTLPYANLTMADLKRMAEEAMRGGMYNEELPGGFGIPRILPLRTTPVRVSEPAPKPEIKIEISQSGGFRKIEFEDE